MDKSSNEIWINANNYDDWEISRPLLFREDNFLLMGDGPTSPVRLYTLAYFG